MCISERERERENCKMIEWALDASNNAQGDLVEFYCGAGNFKIRERNREENKNPAPKKIKNSKTKNKFTVKCMLVMHFVMFCIFSFSRFGM